MRKNLLLTTALVTLLAACGIGNSSPKSPNSTIVTISTYDYNPGNKTGVNVSIAGSAPITAEIDTGSDLTVVNESVVGANLIKTTESISVTYGGGENTVSGYLAYGSVTFTTESGTTISTESNTPILVVTQGSVNEGGGNNAILGMRMNNQVSSRLYLPYPYNQMMILNRAMHQLKFGQLNSADLRKFGVMQAATAPCINYGVPVVIDNICWDLESSSVDYQVSTVGGGQSTFSYPTVLDSGEGVASFYFSPAPAWMNYESNGLIENNVTVIANTNKGAIYLPLTPTYYYRDNPDNTVNPGNSLFNYYQVLFDQADGLVGFESYTKQI